MTFDPAEFADRRARLTRAMEAAGLDGLLLFAPDSHYWLTGFDTFGFCFFQCLVVTADRTVLLTRSADLRQARLTSNIEDVRIWRDGLDDPGAMLAAILAELGIARPGIELDTHGLTAGNHRRLPEAVQAAADASALVPALRLAKSPAEIACARRAGALADAAFDAALEVIGPGADEAAVLAALQGAVFAGGGDYPGNPVIIGSGERALLCRYATGRRRLDDQDQITLEWAGVWRHYHAASMATVVVGTPTDRHLELHDAARAALLACEARLTPGTPMSAVFAAHADTLDARGLSQHRLAACGYALGARYAPSWMEPQMFHAGATEAIADTGVYFLHMILMDSETGTAMSLGRTSLVGAGGAQPLTLPDLDLRVR